VRTFVDELRVRPCGACRLDVIYAPEGDDGNCVQLEVSPVLGVDAVARVGPRRVAWGWAHTGRFWRVHRFDTDPLAYAFLEHTCSGSTVSRKGTRMTADPFGTAAPPGATGPSCEELEGKLILLTVHSIDRGIVTKFGAADAARCDVVDLMSGEVHTDTLLFGKVLVNQLAAGTRYVGRLGKGQAVPPNSPPWVWVDGDDSDKAVAVRYLTYAASQSVSTPAAPAPTAQPAPAPAFTPAPPAAPATPAAPPAAAPPWAQ
jgi:hypothetical protein